MCEELPCHSCGELTEDYCEDCDQPVCEECTETFTEYNMLDGTHCSGCYDSSQEGWWKECQRREAYEKKRQDKNAKRREWYHSPKQVEKRRLAKIALNKRRRERAMKRMEEVGRILAGFRF